MTTSHDSSQKTLFIAVPVAGNQLSMHFGHCESFSVFEVQVHDGDERSSEIISFKSLTPPPHEPGVLPKWLHEQGVDLVIAGGMGQRAQNNFAANQVKVVVGVTGGNAEDIVRDYLDGKLVSGQNLCDH